MSTTQNEPHLVGKYITVVYKITDPAEWRKTNPMNYRHDGVEAVGVSIGDLMGYSEALEELMPAQFEKQVLALQHEHTPLLD